MEEETNGLTDGAQEADQPVTREQVAEIEEQLREERVLLGDLQQTISGTKATLAQSLADLEQFEAQEADALADLAQRERWLEELRARVPK